MDRSSFHFAGSTNDLEKRQAFKAKLASKIDPPTQELPVTELANETIKKPEIPKVNTFEFTNPEKKFAPVGSTVWHPELGACKVLSIDEKKNTLSLDTPLNGRVDMVLSQVRSKIREIDTIPDHVPVKPLVRESLADRVPQYMARGDVSVELPEVFKSWGRNQQFMFLTRTQHLTTEQANDVFAVIGGKQPIFYGVSVSWQDEETTKANIIPGPEVFSTKIDDVRVFPHLEDKKLWHPDFGECSVASVDEKGNQLILQTSVGQVPFVLDVTLPKLAVLTASVEHAPKRLGTRVLATSNTPVEDRPKVAVTIPETFVTWKTSDQYIFLTKTALLTPECANDIIDSVAGKLNNSDTEYEIIWSD
jgi:hypothetical protein